jgi:hypothetical protein
MRQRGAVLICSDFRAILVLHLVLLSLATVPSGSGCFQNQEKFSIYLFGRYCGSHNVSNFRKFRLIFCYFNQLLNITWTILLYSHPEAPNGYHSPSMNINRVLFAVCPRSDEVITAIGALLRWTNVALSMETRECTSAGQIKIARVIRECVS